MDNVRFKISVFLKRVNRCRGFGIQSPSDFSFVNDVVYQRSPYSEYAVLDKEFPSAGRFKRKLCRTFFRISNHAQPRHYVFPEDVDGMVKAYLEHGCQMSKGDSTLYYDVEPTVFADGDCIIISDIYGRGSEVWNRLSANRNYTHLVMFDLYYFGVAFVKATRFPELHTVNYY